MVVPYILSINLPSGRKPECPDKTQNRAQSLYIVLCTCEGWKILLKLARQTRTQVIDCPKL